MSLCHSFIRSLIDSFNQSFIPSFIHSAVTGVHPSEVFSQEQFDDNYDDDNSDAPQSLEDQILAKENDDGILRHLKVSDKVEEGIHSFSHFLQEA